MKTSRKPSSARRRAGRGGMMLCVGVICLWLAGIGLLHVITMNNIHSLGDQQRVLDLQISELKRDIDNTKLRIAAATTEQKLSARLVDQRTRLRKIRPKEIWHVSVNPELAPLADEPGNRPTSIEQ